MNYDEKTFFRDIDIRARICPQFTQNRSQNVVYKIIILIYKTCIPFGAFLKSKWQGHIAGPELCPNH